MKRADYTRQISDAALALFVQWIQLNHASRITTNPVAVRRTLNAYEQMARRTRREEEADEPEEVSA